MTSLSLSLGRAPRAGGARATSVRLSLGALVTAAVFATALAYSTKLGVVMLLGLCFVPLALLRLPLAICAWIALTFFSRTSALEAVPNKVLLFIGVCWLGLLIGRRANLRGALARNQAAVGMAVVFLAWLIVSLAWAPVPAAGNRPVKELLYAGFGFILVLGTTVERRQMRWVMAAFVAGATASVLWGAAKGGLTVSAGAANEASSATGRFQGGAGDPNYLAALLVPAIMLAGALAARRAPGQRILLALATIVLAIGLAATESRGGLIAAGVCSLVALLIWRGRRRLIASLIALAAGAVVTFFVAKPEAWHRIQESNSGSGRIDIWKVAWRIVHSHPFFGVGLAQFPEVSPHYVLQPGALNYVDLIIEKHIVVHNIYLQLWAEDGIVGLLLFLGLVAISLAAGWRAARLFDAQADIEMSALARGAILALVGMLTASFFLSNLEAGQLWILLALGPALAAIARGSARASPVPPLPG